MALISAAEARKDHKSPKELREHNIDEQVEQLSSAIKRVKAEGNQEVRFRLDVYFNHEKEMSGYFESQLTGGGYTWKLLDTNDYGDSYYYHISWSE